MPPPRSLPIYGGRDEGARPTVRHEVRAALERGVDAVTVVDHVARGLDAILQQVLLGEAPGEAKPACARGCSHCCHRRVEVTAPEVFYVARFLLDHPDPARDGRVMEAAELTRGKDSRAHHLAQIRCALLAEDGACSVYAARPLACRRAHSTDAEVCAAVHREPSLDVRIPFAPSIAGNASAVVLGFYEGAAHAGRPPHQYELHAALAIARADPTAEAREAAGEDPLAAARTRSAQDLVAVLGEAPGVAADAG